MNLGLGQALLIVFICFILFGDFSTFLSNLNLSISKIKKFLNNDS